MAEADSPQSVECVFCLSKDERMVDPLELPCSHVSCRQCLAGQLEERKVLWCKECNRTFDASLDSLPIYQPSKPKHECDICLKKGSHVSAAIYCKTCKKKLCKSHQERHTELLENHTTLTIAQYNEQAERLETTLCSDHETEAYILGCESCLDVFCAHCIAPSKSCKNGKAHQLCNLKDLVTNLTAEIERMIAAMRNKEEELSDLFKESSKTLSEVEEGTETMLEQLHKRRDAQLLAIKTKYEELEKKFLESRKQIQESLNEFMEEKVGGMLTSLSNKRAELEARMRNSHYVDIIQQYKDIQGQAKQPSEDFLPNLLMKDVQKLCFKDEGRDIEVEFSPANNIVIKYKHELVATSSPKSCNKQKTVNLSSFCHAVTQHQEKTFLGTQNCTLDVVDSEYKITTIASLNAEHWIYGIAIKDDKVYTLVSNDDKKPTSINVYDRNRLLLSQWDRNDRSHYTKLVIVSEQLVVADKAGSQLTVYSLTTGQIVKHISCPKLSGCNASLCAVDSSSVVFSSYKESSVQKININTGTTEWEYSEVTNPQALALYKEELVCVARDRELTFLNVHTGQLVSRLAVDDIARGRSHYIDIEIYGDTLVASSVKDETNKLLYYKLNN